MASAAVAAVLAGVAGAFACDGAALLHLSAFRGPAGARVTATGSGFAVPSSTPAPLAAVPAAAGRERPEGLPAPAVAVAGVLLVGVAVALRRQAPGR